MKLCVKLTDELQIRKTKLEEMIKKLSREVALKKDKESVYMQQADKKTVEIETLKTKVSSLEKSLSQLVRNFSNENESAKALHTRKTKDYELEAAGLRTLVALKNKELLKVRGFAQKVLQQRAEVEEVIHIYYIYIYIVCIYKSKYFDKNVRREMIRIYLSMKFTTPMHS